MTSYFPSQSTANPYDAVNGQTYRFQVATLEAAHPPSGDATNKVATTGWVSALLNPGVLFPTVSKSGPDPVLRVNVGPGSVTDPVTSKVCNITGVNNLAVSASSREYIWIRYSDCNVVATTIAPGNVGVVLATVDSNATTITAINNTSTALGWAPVTSPVFSGDPQVPTAPPGDNDNSIANTAWVQNELVDYAELNSPVFIGDPQGPNPPAADRDTSLATTQWVQEEMDRRGMISISVPSWAPQFTAVGGLTGQISLGDIYTPAGTVCNFNGVNNLALDADRDGILQPRIYLWIRYHDCAIMNTDYPPHPQWGMSIAEVVTDNTKIVWYKNLAHTLADYISRHFVTLYGGALGHIQEDLSRAKSPYPCPSCPAP